MKNLILCGASIVVLGVGFSAVQAAPITFTDRNQWEAASLQRGSLLLTVNFDDFKQDVRFHNAGPGVLGPRVDVGPFFLQAFGRPTPDFVNFIDGLGPTSALEDPTATSPYVRLFVSFGQSSDVFDRVIMGFDTPVVGWGADFKGAEMVALELFSGEGPSVTLPVTVSNGFFGFVSDSPIAVIHFKATAGDNSFELDNVSVAVPEGGSTLTFILLGGALGLLSMAGALVEPRRSRSYPSVEVPPRWEKAAMPLGRVRGQSVDILPMLRTVQRGLLSEILALPCSRAPSSLGHEENRHEKGNSCRRHLARDRFSCSRISARVGILRHGYGS